METQVLIRKALVATYCLGLVMGLASCGGDTGFVAAGSPEAPVELTLHGVFIDSAVEGVRVESGRLTSTTDNRGAFLYRSRSSVKFYIGDILLGETEGASLITPIELVDGASSVNHPTVTNIARFLQTLDDDASPDNGIKITPTVFNLGKGKVVNFDQSIDDFTDDGDVQVLVASMTAATTAGARTLVDADTAQAHLRASLIATLEK